VDKLTLVELKRAECAFVDLQLPGGRPETVGVLLLDTASNKLHLKFRKDWTAVAPEEHDVLELLEGDLERQAEELGGKQVLAYLEEHWSNMLRISERESMVVADFPARLRRLFRENVRVVLAPYKTHLPLTSCQAAAGHLGEQLGLNEIKDWVEAPDGLKTTEDMFVAKVTGQSMEPLIADGSLCVFRRNVTGSRSGRKLLIEKFGEFDEATRFTIKVYRSSKVQRSGDEGDWEHASIRLEPLNPAYSPWELQPDQFRVVGEFVAVLPAEE
jgi:SOS-response transcriptional repressor LexA